MCPSTHACLVLQATFFTVMIRPLPTVLLHSSVVRARVALMKRCVRVSVMYDHLMPLCSLHAACCTLYVVRVSLHAVRCTCRPEERIATVSHYGTVNNFCNREMAGNRIPLPNHWVKRSVRTHYSLLLVLSLQLSLAPHVFSCMAILLIDAGTTIVRFPGVAEKWVGRADCNGECGLASNGTTPKRCAFPKRVESEIRRPACLLIDSIYIGMRAFKHRRRFKSSSCMGCGITSVHYFWVVFLSLFLSYKVRSSLKHPILPRGAP